MTHFNLSNTIYSVNDIDELLVPIQFYKNEKSIEYGNVACVIDIETSSFIDNGKYACMYAFVFGINGKCIIGRTYDELIYLINCVVSYYDLNDKRRIIFGVHNLAYEFQFFKNWFEWSTVFSLDTRKPVKAIMKCGIELRCTYILSNASLATVGKNLTTYKVEKMVGDLDYSLIRHSQTPLNAKELGYILNDGLVVMAYIKECIEADGNITKLPLTNTGYVRNTCRKFTMSSDKNSKQYYSYRKLMRMLTISSIEEYHQLQRAFQGGFTHANAMYVGHTMTNVTSYDFTSSYPAVMLTKQYPMTKGERVKIKNKYDFEYNLSHFCCLFDVEFDNLKSKVYFEHPLSFSKCKVYGNYEIDNGRLVYSDKVQTTLTEQDYYTLKEFYSWDKMKIARFRRYGKGYLPTDFVKAILYLYKAKTTLKGVKGSEVEYQRAKGQLNACYGMCVTNICRNEFIYDGDWSTKEVNKGDTLNKYNKSLNRFLFYPWGIWVTAHARRNLFSGIKELGDDYIYSDTDSIKAINMNKHMEYINNYNSNVLKELKKAMLWHKIPIEEAMPTTIDGETKLIGVWDYDGSYDKFKTLGAKRYMTKEDDHINITVSGLNKNITVPYLLRTYDDPFEAFNDGLYVPSEYTGKNIHTYIDDERIGTITDYLGNIGEYHEKSVVHLSASDYDMSMTSRFIEFLKRYQEEKLYE